MGATWSTIFEEQFLTEANHDVIIHCPFKHYATELFLILFERGFCWANGEQLDDTHWEDSKEGTCYRVIKNSHIIRKGYLACYEESEYRDAIKCVFYGLEDEGFETASDDRLFDYLGIK